MTDGSREFRYNSALIGRTKDLRESLGWSAEQMATALGIPPDRYRKYENRSPIPIYLIEQFAQITGSTVTYVVTGRSVERLASQRPTKTNAA